MSNVSIAARIMDGKIERIDDMELLGFIYPDAKEKYEPSQSIHTFHQAPIGSMKYTEGIKAAAIIKAIIELGRRTITKEYDPTPEKSIAQTPITAARYLLQKYSNTPQEQAGLVLLNSSGHILSETIISRGAKDTTNFPMDVVARLILSVPTHFIVAFHNHPTGDVTPSKPDKIMAQRLQRLASLFDTQVLDSYVIGNGKIHAIGCNVTWKGDSLGY